MVYQTVPDDEVRRLAEETIPKLEAWFVANPTRKICKLGWLYGKSIDIRRGHAAEDMNKHRDKALKNNAKKT